MSSDDQELVVLPRPTKRKRGPYKQYLYQGLLNEKEVPWSTRRRVLQQWPKLAEQLHHETSMSDTSEEPMVFVGDLNDPELQNQRLSDSCDDVPPENDDTCEFLLEYEEACINVPNNDGDDEENTDSEPDDADFINNPVNNPNNDQDIDDDVLKELLYDGARINLGHAIITVMSYSIRHQLTKVALINLLGMLDVLLPDSSIMPRTHYLISKFFNQHYEHIEFHVVCTDCHALLQNTEIVICPDCQKRFTRKQLLQKNSFFIYMNLKEQLTTLLKKDVNTSSLSLGNRPESSKLHDIYDGKMYKDFLDGELTRGVNSLSVSMHYDGAPVFKQSTSGALYPLQMTLNELSPCQRKKNIMLVGLWFGKGKPPIYSFFQHVCQELNDLAINGVQWIKNGVPVTSKVFLLVSPCDSVARPTLQNFTQFNGEYGCAWCLNPGVRVDKGRGAVRVYEFNDIVADRRPMTQMIDYATRAMAINSQVFGVKGPSPLMNIQGFDYVDGLPPDCLHAVFHGVAKQMTGLWLDSANHEEPFYIGLQRDQIDQNLLKVHPTSEITRLPRSLNHRADWKAYEWRSWLLFYSLPVLKEILPRAYLNHLLLFVDSIFRLNKDSIEKEDIRIAHIALSKFVIQFKDLYGLQHMSFNLHQLLHLTSAVKHWGPLWTFSSTWFEGNIGLLKKMFNGTRAVSNQIARTFHILKGIRLHVEELSKDGDLPENVELYLRKVLDGQVHAKKATSVDGVHMIGTGMVRDLTIQEKYAAERHLGKEVSQAAHIFSKCITKNIVFHSLRYRLTRRVDHIVRLCNSEAAVIENFAIVQTLPNEESKTVMFVRYLELKNTNIVRQDQDSGANASHIRYVRQPEDMIRAIDITDIINKYICIGNAVDLRDQIICALPNFIERD